jgi:hypothetical protein
VLVLLALTGALGACHAEPVIPFPDAGDPCATRSGNHAIDCARFPDTTCGASSTSCPREIYGCADAAYFSTEDYSQCPPEAGGRDATLFGDVSLFPDDAFTGREAPDGGDGGGEEE